MGDEMMGCSLNGLGEITKHWKNKVKCRLIPKVSELQIPEVQFTYSRDSKWYCLELCDTVVMCLSYSKIKGKWMKIKI